MRSLAIMSLLATMTAGCNNRYEALTAPPPGLTASLDDENNSIRLSRGVSLGFECQTSGGDPCNQGVASNDSAIALVFPAALDGVGGPDFMHGPQPRTAFVVVGIAEGQTSVQAGGESLSVRVLLR